MHRKTKKVCWLHLFQVDLLQWYGTKPEMSLRYACISFLPCSEYKLSEDWAHVWLTTNKGDAD